MNTDDDFVFPDICGCPGCQAPFANASCVFDAEDPAQGSLYLNFPLDALRQTINLNGERRVVVQFDIQSGALENFVNIVSSATKDITDELMGRRASSN